ncbi:MAG: hypothetical protein IJD10_04120, partial [Clostridia bacterium]|nr:hypothetical protein [Clostridia bacterium]
IEVQTPVNVVSFRDEVLEGIISMPDVLGYVNSKEKADATTVLTVDYQKTDDVKVAVPLYSYRDHGNGRVASFTSSPSGEWLSLWDGEARERFFENLLVTCTPEERIDYPFDVIVNYGGNNSTVEILPSYLNPRAVAKIKITAPDGSVLERQLNFDLNRYFTSVKTLQTGKYHVNIKYSYGNHFFEANTYFNVPYNPEYDAFTVFDISSVHDFMRGAGGVYTDADIDLQPDKNTVATYEYNMRIPLLIAAVALFVIDVFIRKTRWRDIVNFFRGKKKKGGAVK